MREANEAGHVTQAVGTGEGDGRKGKDGRNGREGWKMRPLSEVCEIKPPKVRGARATCRKCVGFIRTDGRFGNQQKIPECLANETARVRGRQLHLFREWRCA